MTGAEVLFLAFVLVFLGLFLPMVAFMVIMTIRTVRKPIYYDKTPTPTADELLKQLMCPKCGSKDLRQLGRYTMKCNSCGFTFSIGRKVVRPYGGFWFWPFLWLPLILAYPFTLDDLQDAR